MLFVAGTAVAFGCTVGSAARGAKLAPVSAASFWSQPPAAIRHSFEQRLLKAIDEQQYRWEDEELRVHGQIGRGAISTLLVRHRLAMLHCHADGQYAYGNEGRPIGLRVPVTPYPIPTFIPSAYQPVGVCPNWTPRLDSLIDRSAHPASVAMRSTPPAFPESLVRGLDSAMRAIPDDPWYLRQLVRVLTENGESARAHEALAACSAIEWCALLDGYAQYTQGNWSAASAAWATALSAMPPTHRCLLLSTAELTPVQRDTLKFSSCEERSTLDGVVWWLAKPLLTDTVNYRLIEHLARLVHNELVDDLPRDAFYDLRLRPGGDAVRLMRLRYGWPTHAFWGGTVQDDGHESYVRSKTSGDYPRPPYISPEYSRRAITTMPSLRAAQAPLTISDADFAFDPALTDSGAVPWPQEFFLHPFGALLGIRTHQRALLRRDSSALLLIATRLPRPPVALGPEPSVRVQLVASPRPETVRVLNEATAQWDGRVFLTGPLQQPAVVEVAVSRGGTGIAGARTRFGVATVPTHLASNTACALSDPILLDAASISGAGLTDARRGMLDDLRLQRPVKLGVAWESYGVRASDTVTIAVRVTGLEARSTLARAAQAVGLTGRRDVEVSVSWTEPSPARQAEVVSARIATLMRELTLDIGALRTGAYGLQISMTTAQCTAVSPLREFTVSR